MMAVCYKVDYLPVGVRILFWVNCGGRVIGVRAKFSSEIGLKSSKKAKSWLKFFGGSHTYDKNNIFNFFVFKIFPLGTFKALFLELFS